VIDAIMNDRPIDVIAAGHICLDVIPQLSNRFRGAEDIFTPGVLSQVGPATLALGGSVANTGLALHRLGAKTRLLGKVGNDLLGTAILEALREVSPELADFMIVSTGEPTSYTIVLSPPNIDRGFLHCPGTNDTFTAADLDNVAWHDTRILHFGYPPLMRATFADAGLGLAALFAKAQAAGTLVTLDMATPDPDATNWREWLRNVLPHVDVFLPSLDEIVSMLGPSRIESVDKIPNPDSSSASIETLADLAEELHAFGTPIVVIKLGSNGLYLSTKHQLVALRERAAWQEFNWNLWEQRQLLAPCFEVDVLGTTGSGDCTIAGFLWALINNAAPEQALRWASAVGAHCVESADATSNIPAATEVEARLLQSSWRPREVSVRLPNWSFCPLRGVHVGPKDAAAPPSAPSGF
jgi:sugar/nucleoside kinase (ribokinase family)